MTVDTATSVNGSRLLRTRTTTEAVAEFVAGVRFSTLSNELVEHAKMSLLDLLACVVAGARSEHAQHYLSYFEAQGGSPDSSVALSSQRFTASTAAILNGTYAHATELSETYTRAVVHPGNVIIPAVLAVAERDGLSGQRVISAIATGYEVLIRMGLSVGRAFMLQQGFHIPATTGTFGAAVAVANLRGLDAAAVADTLGITACMVPTSLMVAAKDGASIKDLFEGQAAGTGVLAVDLKESGLTGIVDGLTVWGDAMSRAFSPEPLVDDLGSEWRVLSGGLHFKERALLAMGQPAFDATREIWEAHHIDPAAITGIVVETSGRSSLGGAVHPNNTVAAKASIPFVVAVSLAHQDRVRDDPHFVRTLSAELLADPEVARLADLVTVLVDEQIDREFEQSWPMKFAARVTVTLADGASFSEYTDIWPRTSTYTFDDVAAKFENVTRTLLTESAIAAIVSQVRDLDEQESIVELMSLIRPVRGGNET